MPLVQGYPASGGGGQLAALPIIAQSPFFTPDFYVSPTGGTGAGTIADPWSLAYAFSGAGGRIQPGHVIGIRGGVYTGVFSTSLNGIPSAPIVWRAYPGERVTINSPQATWQPYQFYDQTLSLFGSYQWLWGVEVTGAGCAMALNYQCAEGKFINCITHDSVIGIGFWGGDHDAARGGECSGCLSYNNGPNQNSNGYAIYTQNFYSSKLIQDNILFNNWNKTLHCWGGGYPAWQNQIKNIAFRGNVVFGSGTIGQGIGVDGIAGATGMLVLGTNNIAGLEVTDHYSYDPGVFASFRTGDAPGNIDIRMERCIWTAACILGVAGNGWLNAISRDNTFYSIGLNQFGSDMLEVYPSTVGYIWQQNAHYRDPTATAWKYSGNALPFSSWKATSGLGSTDTNPGITPTGTQVYVRPNLYEAGRANIIIYNWAGLSSVNVDLSSFLLPGQSYIVKNAQNFFGPDVLSGVYAGGTVSFPLAGIQAVAPTFSRPFTPATPTGPTFQVFVVRRQGA